jgi:hypothetical protein
MRPLHRFLAVLVLVLAPLALPAQDPAPAAAASAPDTVSAPGPTPAPGAEPTLTAPDDGPPAADPEAEALVAAVASDGESGTPTDPPSGGSAETLPPATDVAPSRPPAPSVDVAIGTVDTVAEAPSGRARNWVFLAVLGVAAVLIAAKISREKSDRVSIHQP